MMRVWHGLEVHRAAWIRAALVRAKVHYRYLILITHEYDVGLYADYAWWKDHAYMSDELALYDTRHANDCVLRDWSSYLEESDNCIIGVQLIAQSRRSGLIQDAMDDASFLRGIDNSDAWMAEPQFFPIHTLDPASQWRWMSWNAVVSSYLHKPWTHTVPFETQRNQRKL